MAKYVMATCPASEAQNAVNDLMQEGYPRSSITLVADESVVPGLNAVGVEVEDSIDYAQDDETVWEKIKSFFGFDDDEDYYAGALEAHREDVANGSVLVVVEDDGLTDDLKGGLIAKDTGYWRGDNKDEVQDAAKRAERTAKSAVADDDQTIQLEEERLNVDKDNIQAGDVVVHKRVVEENETVNVPLRHEEVVIERRPVASATAGIGDFSDEDITIPLWEEKARVTKEPVVAEEVRIAKNSVEDTQQVNATLRRETLDFDKDGNVVMNEVDDDRAPMQ